MDASERILLALDARDCWAQGTRMRRKRMATPRAIEPMVIHHGPGAADFGTVNGQQSIAELQDLVTLWAYRMQQLDQWYGIASPIWVNKDLTAYSDFTNDRLNLENRYGSALSDAQSTITMGKVNVFVPNSMLPAQAQYDELMKAMLQCYPPDGCPTQKGDWGDLFNRAVAVSPSLGIAAPGDAPPQPAASDADLILRNALPNVTAPGSPSAAIVQAYQWAAAHQTAVLIGAGVLVLLIAIGPLVTALSLPARAAAAVL